MPEKQSQKPNSLKLLCLSTAEQGGSLALVDGDKLICESFWDSKVTHSKRLLPMIEQIIRDRSGFELDDMDGFIAAKGPGSFTGLRIGISVVKALALAMGRPSYGVSSLDGIGYRFTLSARPVCVMMDAKREEVYSAVYRFEDGVLKSKSSEQVEDPEQVLSEIDQPALFVGSGAKVYRDLIIANSDVPMFSNTYQDAVSAAALIQSMGIQDGPVDPKVHPLDPVYLRKSDAELNADR